MEGGNRKIFSVAFDFLVFLLAALFIKTLGLLPRQLALRIAVAIATACFHLDARHRRVMMRNLDIAFPELDRQDKRRIAREAFRNIGRLVAEVSRIPRLNRENISRLVAYDPVNGFDNFKRAYQKGKGVLFLTGHFSSWELLPVAHALYGHPLSFLVRPLDNPYLDRFINRYRSLCGNVPVPKRDSMRHILEQLKRGQCVGILIDQNVQADEGIFVDLFGKKAATTTGLAVLALRTGAAVIPARLCRNRKSETYRMIFYPELELVRTGDLERDIRENTALFNRVLERMIRESPDQWLWGHRRWKTRPPDDPEEVY